MSRRTDSCARPSGRRNTWSMISRKSWGRQARKGDVPSRDHCLWRWPITPFIAPCETKARLIRESSKPLVYEILALMRTQSMHLARNQYRGPASVKTKTRWASLEWRAASSASAGASRFHSRSRPAARAR
eukprot:4419343-Pyramimonas_sp.AAC.1